MTFCKSSSCLDRPSPFEICSALEQLQRAKPIHQNPTQPFTLKRPRTISVCNQSSRSWNNFTSHLDDLQHFPLACGPLIPSSNNKLGTKGLPRSHTRYLSAASKHLQRTSAHMASIPDTVYDGVWTHYEYWLVCYGETVANGRSASPSSSPSSPHVSPGQTPIRVDTGSAMKQTAGRVLARCKKTPPCLEWPLYENNQ